MDRRARAYNPVAPLDLSDPVLKMPSHAPAQTSFLAFCDQALPGMLRLAGRYLAAAAGRTPDLGKAGSPDVAPSALNQALTYMDRFVQDFLILTLLERFPALAFLVEEETSVLRLCRSGDPIATVLIDPIDGTRAFVEGGDDYSTLVTVLIHGVPVRAYGLYPASDRLLIAGRDGGLDDAGAALRLAPLGSDGATRLCGHYRLLQPEYAALANALQAAHFRLAWNGNGFVTNLSAALAVVDGRAVAFLCPYTAAHDALAPMTLIKAAGGVARRYVLGPAWSATTRLPFRFEDVETSPLCNRGAGSPRLRLIGAHSEATLDRIEEVLGRG